MLSKDELHRMYVTEGKSMQEIANKFDCSLNKIKYWMGKNEIQIRSISDAVYLKHNPDGDPFKVNLPLKKEDFFLLGLGLGLYWGEGTKANKGSVRLGNSDPYLIKRFIEFLDKMYGVKREDLKYGLQVFSDMKPGDALKFWSDHLQASQSQFQKVVVTPSRGKGTYRKKIAHGVLTVYYNNRKLRDIVCGELGKLGFQG